jgi:hypothetical protein
MITEKQKCIAEQAVYGDLQGVTTLNEIMNICYINTNTIPNLIRVLPKKGFDYLVPNDIAKPILRPMHLLTHKITHKGYNDDKPFVPLLEIIKQTIFNREFKYKDNKVFYDMGNYKVYCDYIENGTIALSDKQGILSQCNLSIKAIDLLNQWHFDLRGLIDKGEAISTDEVGDVYVVKKDE